MANNDESQSNYGELLSKINTEIIGGSKLKSSDIDMFNPLVLAYVGDAVYELFVRTLLVSDGSMQVAKLHKKSISFVKAKSQAQLLDSIADKLTDEEKDIVRRGRNSKSGTIPKNADIMDYRMATGLEALFGYQFLKGNIDRVVYLVQIIIQAKADEHK